MNRPSSTFYSHLLSVYRDSATVSDGAEIAARLQELEATLGNRDDEANRDIFRRYVRLIDLSLGARGLERPGTGSPSQPELAPRSPDDLTLALRGIGATGTPGISLVTCAMNRTENLLRALPSWLQHDEIREIVIVDWSSRDPVADSLEQAGLDDPRIVVVRVEGEGRWILSYAFNLGFRLSRCAQILKVDADIVLSPDFMQRNDLAPECFIAGNWRNAASDQAFVNGFFFAPRRALARVGGFNEYITTYGWDDDDLYDRLILEGYRRNDVARGTVLHLSHSDAQRSGTPTREGDAETLLARFTAGTRFLIRRNRYVAALMPPWSPDQTVVPFEIVDTAPTRLILRRKSWVPNDVPQHVLETARFHAVSDFLAWQVGPVARAIAPAALNRVLSRPADRVSRLDVLVAMHDPAAVPQDDRPYLVLYTVGSATDPNVSVLANRGRSLGYFPVLQGPATDPDTCAARIDGYQDPGDLTDISEDTLLTGTDLPPGNLRVSLAADILQAPATARARKRLYIDAQHGLGNRLRAIGSAASIARATDRDMVVIWQPDDHCDCRMGDLFDYDGPVLDRSFVDAARADGLVVLNYMALEPGGTKDVPVPETDADIYARSAFVLQSPHSDWQSENAFLRDLRPVRTVLDLVKNIRHPNDVSVHIRMEGGRKDAHLPYESAENWSAEDHDLIDHWRARSHFSHFMKRLDTLVADGRADRIFLAADLPATYDAFQSTYGDRIACLRRDLYDRSAGQLRYALADALLLGQSPRLLGSTWSSFSELAMRLSPKPMTVEMSGKDF